MSSGHDALPSIFGLAESCIGDDSVALELCEPVLDGATATFSDLASAAPDAPFSRSNPMSLRSSHPPN